MLKYNVYENVLENVKESNLRKKIFLKDMICKRQ